MSIFKMNLKENGYDQGLQSTFCLFIPLNIFTLDLSLKAKK